MSIRRRGQVCYAVGRDGDASRPTSWEEGYFVGQEESVIADEEQRTITQVCEMLLHEGVESYKNEGPKFMQRLVAKQKARVKDA